MGTINSSTETRAHALSLDEACVRAGLCKASVYKAIKSGRLVARKNGRRTVVLHSDLLAWLNSLPRIEPNPARGGS
ncbi:MAG: helix-turn-helix domain-containing protein [Alphaproteobacteria bacterium]|nr:helix-turn-helix domain-containing protein [Alphaproteobacteria bacterium]